MYVGKQSMQGFIFDVYELPYDVDKCLDAAFAKGISLEMELKSLVLVTSKGLYVLHLPGNKWVNIRAVKRELSVKEVVIPIKMDSDSKKRDVERLDQDNKLSSLDIVYGTVCPFLDNIWFLPHLISQDIFKQKKVSTNNGKLNQYFFFNPMILKQHPNHVLGDFSK